MPNGASDPARPRLVLTDPDDALSGLLRRAQLALVQHPVAAQALIRALVREGRAYAHTEQGQARKERLADSELVQRARAVWEGLTLNMFTDDERTAVPSVLVDAVFGAAARDDLERVLAALFVSPAGSSTGPPPPSPPSDEPPP